MIGPCPPPPDIFDIIPSDIQLRTASDGSVENENGYHGWIIARTDNTKIIEGYGPSYDRIENTTSYRTEFYGTIAVLTVYGMIQSVYKWQASTIEHVCDSESALDRIWNKEKDCVFDPSRPDADAITVAKLLLYNTKHTIISPLWVRGHADKRGLRYTLQEEINMQTDNLAKKAHTNLPLEFKARHDCLHFPEHHISLLLNEKKVTSKITRHVLHIIHYPSLKKYLTEKEEWNECTWNEIAWSPFKIAFNKIPSARQPTITKMLFSFWCLNIRHL
jgi:hypothetical protein